MKSSIESNSGSDGDSPTAMLCGAGCRGVSVPRSFTALIELMGVSDGDNRADPDHDVVGVLCAHVKCPKNYVTDCSYRL